MKMYITFEKQFFIHIPFHLYLFEHHLLSHQLIPKYSCAFLGSDFTNKIFVYQAFSIVPTVVQYRRCKTFAKYIWWKKSMCFFLCLIKINNNIIVLTKIVEIIKWQTCVLKYMTQCMVMDIPHVLYSVNK